MSSDPKLPFGGEPAIEVSPEPSPHSLAGDGDGSPHASSTPRPPIATARLWLRRVGVLLFVFFCATLGVMLVIVPWLPQWSDNPLLFPYPAVREVVSSGFVRGLVTGLGLLNVWIGFWEALQYRED